MNDSEWTKPKSELACSDKLVGDSQYRWLAHELHDGLLQWVVGARMQVESALSKLEKDSPVARQLEQAVAHMLKALAEGRSLIGFFEGQEIGECGAVREIAAFIDSVQSLANDRGQTIRLELPNPLWPDLPKQVAWSLLRFVQQAVQNAIQHAGPAHIDVRLSWKNSSDEPSIAVGIEDDGVGFDTTRQALEGHIGLQSLQQRAQMCGGRFSLKSAPGKGCQVALSVPPVA